MRLLSGGGRDIHAEALEVRVRHDGLKVRVGDGEGHLVDTFAVNLLRGKGSADIGRVAVAVRLRALGAEAHRW